MSQQNLNIPFPVGPGRSMLRSAQRGGKRVYIVKIENNGNNAKKM